MSKALLCYGESGAGKTTSMRTLDPKTTFYIDADKKGLSWRGWREQYNAQNKNYMKTSQAAKVIEVIRQINNKRPEIKAIVIDTLNGIMLTDEMSRMKEKNFDKWQDLAASIWDIIETANNCRPDLTIICIAHSQTERDDNGFVFTRMKTSGKKLDKIVVESKFTTVLYAKCVDGRYIFETRANKSTAKTPLGAFDKLEIDNDMGMVLKTLEEY